MIPSSEKKTSPTHSSDRWIVGTVYSEITVQTIIKLIELIVQKLSSATKTYTISLNTH